MHSVKTSKLACHRPCTHWWILLLVIKMDAELIVYFQLSFVECTNRNLICRMPHIHKNNIPWLLFQGRQVLLIDPVCQGNYTETRSRDCSQDIQFRNSLSESSVKIISISPSFQATETGFLLNKIPTAKGTWKNIKQHKPPPVAASEQVLRKYLYASVKQWNNRTELKELYDQLIHCKFTKAAVTPEDTDHWQITSPFI